MKMAKATEEEWDRAMKFALWVSSDEAKELDDEEFGKQVGERCPHLCRIIYGYKVLVDNCADPNLDYLEFKPEIKAAMEAAGLPT